MSSYRNRWIPSEALKLLSAEGGAILDVGGGTAPYFRASHVLDILDFDEKRLSKNSWGADGPNGERRVGWRRDEYTQMDLSAGQPWPFDAGQFDLGLCSHTLEDLRDPLPVLKELCRVSRRVMIIAPSRLAEQTRGLEHPSYCGFYHHPWMVYGRGKQLVFRRKTPLVLLPGCHVTCPPGKRLKVECGSSVFVGSEFEPVEEAFFSEERDRDDYVRFVESVVSQNSLFEPDPERSGLRYLVWRWRQRWLGHV